MGMKRERETSELIGAARRMLKAVGVRAADDDPIIIRQLLELRDFLDEQIAEAVRGQRRYGMTWQTLADELGVTRQACLMRWPDC
jgi:hypothetical protein